MTPESQRINSNHKSLLLVPIRCFPFATDLLIAESPSFIFLTNSFDGDFANVTCHFGDSLTLDTLVLSDSASINIGSLECGNCCWEYSLQPSH